MNLWTVLKGFLKKVFLDRCKFFSSLKNECISEKNYSNAINVWNTFKMNTMIIMIFI